VLIDSKHVIKFKKAASKLKKIELVNLFKKDVNRSRNFTVNYLNINFDFSKNFIDNSTRKSLQNLLIKNELKQKIDHLLKGQNVNVTENRRVGHFWLREGIKYSSLQEFNEQIEIEEKSFLDFAEDIRNGVVKSFSNETFSDVVSVGIGGSDLGPNMVYEALKASHDGRVNVHFVSNIDQVYLDTVLKSLNPNKTLVLIISKTFTTLETLENAKYIKKWLSGKDDSKDVSSNIVAITTDITHSEKFGIRKDRTFLFWDWVGGRYSLFSAVGISIALGYGAKIFKELKAGAGDFDKVLTQCELNDNPSFWHAVVSIWNLNFMKFNTLAIIPYSSLLSRFPAFLQQTWMESNGKSVQINGKKSKLLNSPIIFGEPGTNSQHSFFQMIQQGNQIIPVDFILIKENYGKEELFNDQLVANALAQSMTMMTGKKQNELLMEGTSTQLIKHKEMPGNRPSNIIWLKNLDAYNLGQLISFYEISIMIQGFILNINSFDQFGVELGKSNAKQIYEKIKGRSKTKFDDSTEQNLKFYKKN
jgi:glucose-6-phosphate isomerase